MRERKYLTFDMENPRHRKAFSVFCTQSSKLRSEFVVNCILDSMEENRLEEIIKQVIGEALNNASFSVSNSPDVPIDLKTTENVSELPDILLTSLDEV